MDGYDEAKRILQDIYGKDILDYKALIKDLEGLTALHNTHKIKEAHDFCNKLAKTVRAGSSYICTKVLTKLKLKPVRKEHKSI